MSIEWKPARYKDGWWAELPGNRSAWIYRPSQGRPLKPLNYLLISVHFSDEPLRRCWARLTGDDPKIFLPEATRFLQSKNLIPDDSRTAFPEASGLIQPPLL
jgi:hypothetical protein